MRRHTSITGKPLSLLLALGAVAACSAAPIITTSQT